MAKTARTQAGFLGTMDIFKGLTSEQRREVEARMTERRYAKGDPIFLEGEKVHSVWFVKEGRVKAIRHMQQGRDLTVCSVGRGSLFGTCCCFSAETYPCNTVAETPVTVLQIPMTDFLFFMRKYPAVSTGLVTHLSERLRASKDMQSFDQESVEKRLLHVLALMHSEFGDVIPLTRREIAEMAGTTVETCIRTMKKLERAGLVSSERGSVTIRNAAALAGRLEPVE